MLLPGIKSGRNPSKKKKRLDINLFESLCSTGLYVICAGSEDDIVIPCADLGLEDVGQIWQDNWQQMLLRYDPNPQLVSEQSPADTAQPRWLLDLQFRKPNAFELAFLNGVWLAQPLNKDKLFYPLRDAPSFLPSGEPKPRYQIKICHPDPPGNAGHVIPNSSVLKFFTTDKYMFDSTRGFNIRKHHCSSLTCPSCLQRRKETLRSWSLITLHSFSSAIKLSFWFMVIDNELAQKTVPEDGDPLLLWLLRQHTITSNLLSCFDYEELNDTLLATSASVMDMLRGRVPWTTLQLDSSLDSRQKCVLASPSRVVELTCRDLLSPKKNTNDVLWHGCEAYLGGKNLKKLVVNNVRILTRIELSPQISYFGFLNANLITIPEDLLSSPNVMVLKSTITALSIIVHLGTPKLHAERLLAVPQFTCLRNLQLKPRPDKAFWSELPLEFCSRIENLSVVAKVDYDDNPPAFRKFRNVRGLRVFAPGHDDAVDGGWEDCLGEALRLPHLHTLMLDKDDWTPCRAVLNS